MKANIIAIGDELLIGQTVNTNAVYISQKLTSEQIRVQGSLIIPDEKEIIISEIQKSMDKYDLTIMTGGLGPTHDDVTKKAIVECFNTELIINKNALEHIKELFASRGRKITKVNEEQALLPANAEPISNIVGTAPGIWINNNGKILIAMPGVPFEMKEMFSKIVIPKLHELNIEKEKVLRIKTLLTTGIPESTLYELLGKINELPIAKIAYLPNQFGVKIRITTEGFSENDAEERLMVVEQKIRSIAGRFIYGTNEQNLEEIVGRLLVDRQLKIAVAESCTGGLVANRLTNISGSSEYFERAIISYSNGSKVEELGVDEDMLEKYGAVSLQVAQQMAEGVRATSGTDIGIATTGIMGPTGATPNKPVGLVYIGYCDEKICTARQFKFSGDRLLNKDRTSQAALEMIRRNILGISYDD